jgi:hypothetical protein
MGSLVEVIPQRLRSISPEKAAEKPAPGKWSEKEELGHLLDSAANNHQRMVRTQLEDSPALPGYAQDQWVALHRYQERGWGELIEIWETLNRQLLAAAEAASPEQRQRTCSVVLGTAHAQFCLRRLCRPHVAPPRTPGGAGGRRASPTGYNLKRNRQVDAMAPRVTSITPASLTYH